MQSMYKRKRRTKKKKKMQMMLSFKKKKSVKCERGKIVKEFPWVEKEREKHFFP